MAHASRDVWVFAYGSLMWQPGFAYAEARHARLAGYHRAFCVYSILYRGSPARPGLVLGLARGGACEGMAFRLPAEGQAKTLAYLRRRELVYGVYREAMVQVELIGSAGAAHATAVAFVAEPAHPSHAGRLPLAAQAALIRGARGIAGPNLDYLINTAAHLGELGIREPSLNRLIVLTGAFAARGAQETTTAGSRTQSLTSAWAGKPTAMPRIPRDRRFGYRGRIGALKREDTK